MASGALEAIKSKSGFAGILAHGVDGTPSHAGRPNDGPVAAECPGASEINLKSVHDLLTGVEDEINIDVGNPLVTQENAQEFVDLHKERLIDQ